jgi:hypothetical protein
MNVITGVLYLLISAVFGYNFNVILQRIEEGSNKVNKYSLFATSSLVLIFFTQAISCFGGGLQLVLLAQTYLLWTVFYIAYSKKAEENR